MTATTSVSTPGLWARLRRTSLVARIAIGLVLGIALAGLAPGAALSVAILGQLFVTALKGVAPLLVFVLVIASVASHQHGQETHMRPILLLYALGTLGAAVIAVLASTVFPSTLVLSADAAAKSSPDGVGEVLGNLLLSAVDNPVHALMNANYIGILAWAIGLGFMLRHAGAPTRAMLQDAADAVSGLARLVIGLAPIGIFGLVASTLAEAGLATLWRYAHLLAVLLGCMAFVALVLNPLIAGLMMRRNPFPLVLTSLRESGVPAFFTRSSAVNIPINMALCERLGLHRETYAISIPLGATVNMAGAAVTITVMTMAAAHTLGIAIDLPSAILLSIVASIAACGVSGVAGGSLLLIPVACSLFGITGDVAMQVVAIGFIISVLQDSVETALNSSTDVVFTGAACAARDPQSVRI